jgi:hypothetical protein
MRDLRPETPFPKHVGGYLFLKIAVIAVAAAIGAKLVGLW